MRARTPARRETSPISTALLPRGPEGGSPLRLLDRELEARVGILPRQLRRSRVEAHTRLATRSRTLQDRWNHVAQADERAAEAQLQLAASPPELSRQDFRELRPVVLG